MKWKNKIGPAMKRLRWQKMLNQKEVSSDLGICQSWLSEIEKGRKLPTLDLLIEWCSVLKMKPSEFMAELEK